MARSPKRQSDKLPPADTLPIDVDTKIAPTESDEDKPAIKTVAAIDIGTNAVRMVIAEVDTEGNITPIERLNRAVRLGQDTFRTGRLAGKTMRAAVSIMRDYAKLLHLYDVAKVRAVATSAVREAINADTLIDRINMVTGISVDIIGTPEESRLTVSAVHNAADKTLDEAKGNTLIVDVGGGNTLLTLFGQGTIISSQAVRLGAIRIQETLGTSEDTPKRRVDLFRQQASRETSFLAGLGNLDDTNTFIGIGSDIRFAADQIGEPTLSDDLTSVNRESFDKFITQCVRYHPEELARKHGISFAQAETLIPALVTYQILLHKTQADRLIVSQVSMRDGLLLELAREVTGREDKKLQQSIISSALSIAQKYHADMGHANSVSELSVMLFDELQTDHGLGNRMRLLLRVAGILHEIGGFISDRAHHKHGYYLVNHSDVFGLTRDELRIVAHVVRYHRRGVPKQSHSDYIVLPRTTRVTINKLAAILRVADAVLRSRNHSPKDFRFDRHGDELLVLVRGASGMVFEQRALKEKGNLFEDIFGMTVHLEEA
ncbi:MAG: Ppx/GppA phosphatase family protein [Planctomycetia bacterium]|jgi:exopolyphosphatase/guanosine-5'-triphosphate,3'-diphosphate pyrophosphatase